MTRPVVIASAVAAGSVVLLVVGVTQGWLGPDVGRGANFCEAARHGLVRQPANTYSNLGFVVAGLLVARRAAHLPHDAVMSRTIATFFACVVVLLGPGSAAMHATQSEWGGHLDMLSMYLVAGFAAARAWVRWVRRGTSAFVTAYVACVAACEVAGLWPDPVPVVHYAGNLAFGVLLLFGFFAGLGWPYYAGLALIAVALVYEHRIAARRDVDAINQAFFHSNAIVGLIFVVAIAVDTLMVR